MNKSDFWAATSLLKIANQRQGTKKPVAAWSQGRPGQPHVRSENKHPTNASFSRKKSCFLHPQKPVEKSRDTATAMRPGPAVR